MSKSFYETKESVKPRDAKDYHEIIGKDRRYLKTLNSGARKWFAYCTDCRNIVFLEERQEKKDNFFKHHKNYVDDIDALLTCSNYFPEKGKRDQEAYLSDVKQEKINRYVIENAFWIYTFVVKTIGDELIIPVDCFVEYLCGIFFGDKRHQLSSMLSVSKLPFNFLCLLNDPPGVMAKEEIVANNVSTNFKHLAGIEKGVLLREYDDVAFIGDYQAKKVCLKVYRRLGSGSNPMSECLYEKSYPIDFGFENYVANRNYYQLPLILTPEKCKSEGEKKQFEKKREKYYKIKDALSRF